MKKLRIAEIGSIWERTPPPLYGGTERVIANITEELVRRGHRVTLFATGDSKTKAKLDPSVPRPLYRDNIPWVNFLYPLHHISRVFERADEFDVIHMHVNTRQDYGSLVLGGFVATPVVYTLHFVLPRADEQARRDRYLFLEKYRRRNFTTISDAQRTIPFLNYVATVPNGVDTAKIKFQPRAGNYLVWLGRICKDKGTREAIAVAKRSGEKLILAGKIDKHNDEYLRYYEKEVRPHIDGKRIRYVGEVGDAQKNALFARAKALLHPIRWNEPFGLVPVEAMAAGVPVIAFDRGPVREHIVNGMTGFLVRNVPEMARAVKRVGELDRKRIRAHALQHFSVARMTDGYETVFRTVLAKRKGLSK